MEYEAARARDSYYERAWAALPRADEHTLFAAEIMGRTYFALLETIERRRFRVFGGRVSVPTPTKLAIALRCWVQSRWGETTGVKAAVYTGPGTLQLGDWPEPRIGPGELLVRVRGCGLCGSDILKVTSPATKAPAVFGHEVVGRGRGGRRGRHAVPRRRAGRRRPPRALLRLSLLPARQPLHVPTLQASNLDPGGFAELCRVPAPNVEHATFALPDTMSDETASFTEPLACCLRAVKRCRVEAGDTVIVVGLGSIGCLLAQASSAHAGRARFRRRPRAGAPGSRPQPPARGSSTRTPTSMRRCARPRTGAAPMSSC